jgi:hypothetical protein
MGSKGGTAAEEALKVHSQVLSDLMETMMLENKVVALSKFSLLLRI